MRGLPLGEDRAQRLGQELLGRRAAQQARRRPGWRSACAARASVTVTASLSEPSMSCSCSRVGVGSSRARARGARGAGGARGARPRPPRSPRQRRPPTRRTRSRVCRLRPPRMPPDTCLSSRVGRRKVKFRAQAAPERGRSAGRQRSARRRRGDGARRRPAGARRGPRAPRGAPRSRPTSSATSASACHMRELALDPDEQPLELDERAQRRVAAQLGVGLQAPELLGGPAGRHLERDRA